MAFVERVVVCPLIVYVPVESWPVMADKGWRVKIRRIILNIEIVRDLFIFFPYDLSRVFYVGFF